MPVPEDKRLKFFVYVVESPSAVDLYHGRTEADLIRKAVALNVMPCVTRTAINLESFIAAIRVGLSEQMEERPGVVPILHISAHGFADGIELSSGEVLQWHELGTLLRPINQALSGTLFVCMSTCEGFAGSRMAMELEQTDHPFFAIVGNCGKPTWPETAVAFATFYHLIANGHYVTEAVEAMRAASGNAEFFSTRAEEAKQGYLEFVEQNRVDTERAAAELEQANEDEPPSEFAKLLRRRRLDA